MFARLVLVCLFLLVAFPAFSQQRTSQPIDGRLLDVRPEPPRDLDARAARMRAMQHDVEELSILSATLQNELRQLQKGMLAKDLTQNLKKVEKLSKKVRQAVSPH